MGVNRGAGGKVANRMSRDAAKRLHAGEKKNWREHEKSIENALRLNGWEFWRDRVMPKRYGNVAQRVGRKAGLPDFIAYKMMPDGTARFLFIEAKTGRAETTEKQQGWVDAANKCRGDIRGLVVYPLDMDKLIDILGGERGAF